MIRDRRGVAVRKPPMDTFTVWGDPNERFPSQYGLVTYREWCDKEVGRLAAAGKTAVVRDADDGEIALAEVGDDGGKDSVQQNSVGGVPPLP